MSEEKTPFELRKMQIDAALGRVDLQKPEGSRGGKVIGHTRSGKPIYEKVNHSEHKDYTKEEKWDIEQTHWEKKHPKEVAQAKEMAKRYPFL